MLPLSLLPLPKPYPQPPSLSLSCPVSALRSVGWVSLYCLYSSLSPLSCSHTVPTAVATVCDSGYPPSAFPSPFLYVPLFSSPGSLWPPLASGSPLTPPVFVRDSLSGPFVPPFFWAWDRGVCDSSETSRPPHTPPSPPLTCCPLPPPSKLRPAWCLGSGPRTEGTKHIVNPQGPGLKAVGKRGDRLLHILYLGG